MGYALYATEQTSAFLRKNGIANTRLYKVHETKEPNIRDFIARRKIDFVISVPDPERKASSTPTTGCGGWRWISPCPS